MLFSNCGTRRYIDKEKKHEFFLANNKKKLQNNAYLFYEV